MFSSIISNFVIAFCFLFQQFCIPPNIMADGFADKVNWPGYSVTKNSGATGSGFRGGPWANDAVYMSNRFVAAYVDTTRSGNYGFRASRAWY